MWKWARIYGGGGREQPWKNDWIWIGILDEKWQKLFVYKYKTAQYLI